MRTDKSLGQHWLFDEHSLEAMAEAAEVKKGDYVLEIGPGLGTLTSVLLERGAEVTTVEFDEKLIPDLLDKFAGDNFNLINQDILKFDFSTLPVGYKIVANIPYYLTSNLLRVICESSNRPSYAALLVQKEVAERVTASAGELSILAVSVQLYALATLGEIVPANLFTPPPKVDSRILRLRFYDSPLADDVSMVMRYVKAGFSNPRKKLRSSMSSGLGISTEAVENLFKQADIDYNRRPQTLSISEWINLTEVANNLIQ